MTTYTHMLAGKFMLSKMSCGDVNDFREGLSARVGVPNFHFMKAMQAEHCHTEMSHTPFTTKNYGVSTSSHNEWCIVADHNLSNADMRCGRRVPCIEELQKNPTVVAAKLWPVEVISVVLYSGYVSVGAHAALVYDNSLVSQQSCLTVSEYLSFCNSSWKSLMVFQAFFFGSNC